MRWSKITLSPLCLTNVMRKHAFLHTMHHEKTRFLPMRKQRRRSAPLFFTTRIVQFLYLLNPKFPASSQFLCFYSSVCVGPVPKPHCWFSLEWLICKNKRADQLSSDYRDDSSSTVQPHHNAPHYDAVFNITRPCHNTASLIKHLTTI